MHGDAKAAYTLGAGRIRGRVAVSRMGVWIGGRRLLFYSVQVSRNAINHRLHMQRSDDINNHNNHKLINNHNQARKTSKWMMRATRRMDQAEPRQLLPEARTLMFSTVTATTGNVLYLTRQ